MFGPDSSAAGTGPGPGAGASALQGSLLSLGPPRADHRFGQLQRTELAGGAWIDHQPGWLEGSDELWASLVGALPWRQRERPMYQRILPEPRLTAWLPLDDPGVPPALADLARLLSDHYQRPLRTVGCNWYRDGRDSVAWHGDRVPRPGQALVAIVSLGARRPFLLRPRDGGPSRRHALGRGDLLVMGGTCQATWQHCVPKVARAEPRISVTFRD